MKTRLLLATIGMVLGGCDPQVAGAIFDRMDGGCRNYNSCRSYGSAPVHLPPPPMGYHEPSPTSTTFYYTPGGPVVPVLRIGR